MKAPHLNEFLRRAAKNGILKNLIIDFTQNSHYNMGTGKVTVRSSGTDGVEMKDDEGAIFRWGLGYSSGSAAITGIRQGRHLGKSVIVLELGSKCNGQGLL